MRGHIPSRSDIKVSVKREKKKTREIKPGRKQKWGSLGRDGRKADGERNLIAKGCQAKRVLRMGCCLGNCCHGHGSNV